MAICDGYLWQHNQYSSMCPLSDFGYGCSTSSDKGLKVFPKFYFTKENWKKIPNFFLPGHTKDFCWGK